MFKTPAKSERISAAVVSPTKLVSRTGIQLLSFDDTSAGQLVLVAEHCSFSEYESIMNDNADYSGSFVFDNRNVFMINELRAQSFVHHNVSKYFDDACRSYNIGKSHQVTCYRDTSFRYTNNYSKAADAVLVLQARQGIVKNGNVHIEVAYGQELSTVLGFVHNLLNNDPVEMPQAGDIVNHLLGYLALKFSYPVDPLNPGMFQAVAVLFLRNNAAGYNIPVSINSFGTIPLSAASLERVLMCVNAPFNGGGAGNVSFAGHPHLFHGDGLGGPPCNLANRGDPDYNLSLPGAVMLGVTRFDQVTNPVIPDAATYNFNINLFEVSFICFKQLCIRLFYTTCGLFFRFNKGLQSGTRKCWIIQPSLCRASAPHRLVVDRQRCCSFSLVM